MEFPNSSRQGNQESNTVHQTPPTKAPRHSDKRTGFSFSNLKPNAAEGTASRGEFISQATNESCSSGGDEDEDRGEISGRIGSPTTPYESYA